MSKRNNYGFHDDEMEMEINLAPFKLPASPLPVSAPPAASPSESGVTLDALIEAFADACYDVGFSHGANEGIAEAEEKRREETHAALLDAVSRLQRERDEMDDNDVLQILCRAFDEWEPIYEEWLSWYNPTDWLHRARGFGAFMRKTLDARNLDEGIAEYLERQKYEREVEIKDKAILRYVERLEDERTDLRSRLASVERERDGWRDINRAHVNVLGEIAQACGWNITKAPPEGALTVLRLVKETLDAGHDSSRRWSLIAYARRNIAEGWRKRALAAESRAASPESENAAMREVVEAAETIVPQMARRTDFSQSTYWEVKGTDLESLSAALEKLRAPRTQEDETNG